MVRVEKAGTSGMWPLRWRVFEGGDALGPHEVEALFHALAAELAEIDDQARYEDCLPEKEWAAVVRSLQDVLATSSARGAGCLCLGGGGSGGGSGRLQAVADEVQQEVLQPFNLPLKGRFTRKVEWTVSCADEGDHLVLELNPREGYAKWAEADKEKMRIKARESMQRRLAAGVSRLSKRLSARLSSSRSRANSSSSAAEVPPADSSTLAPVAEVDSEQDEATPAVAGRSKSHNETRSQMEPSSLDLQEDDTSASMAAPAEAERSAPPKAAPAIAPVPQEDPVSVFA